MDRTTNSPGPRRLGYFGEGDGYYWGDSFPQQPETVTTSHPYHFPECGCAERATANVPPHQGGLPMTGLSPPCTSCSPQWRVAATASHSASGVQEEGRYDASCNVWPDAQSEHDNAPYAPDVAIPYNNQNQLGDTGNTNRATVHQSGNNIPACEGPYGRRPPTTADFRRTECATESGLGSALDAARASNAAGANAQPRPLAPSAVAGVDSEAPPRSEGMMSIARHYVLDPRARVDGIHMGPGAYGRLKIVITLEVPDGSA